MDNGKVYFIGAGPGDPELITVKGRRIIESADVIVYAGSLVNEEILRCRKPAAAVHNSASMTLGEVIAVMRAAAAEQRLIARVHTGDPSIYGAIREQIDALVSLGIPYEVIPGVSSFTAAAAALGREFTLPGVTQTIICTRMEGRTGVPEQERLELLAAHRSSLAIFLSVHMIQEVVDKLIPHYGPDAPVAVVQKATWPDQKIIAGTLADIARSVEAAGIDRTALILVGNFLDGSYEKSKLYDEKFTHGFRQAI